MDTSGKNRYELLFMDEDVSDPLDNVVRKKQPNQLSTATSASSNTTQQAPSKQKTQNLGENTKNVQPKKLSNTAQAQFTSGAEKENKSSAMNKNFDRKTNNTQSGNTSRGDREGLPANKQKFGSERGVANKEQSGSYRQRDNQTREGGQQQQQQQQRNGNLRQQQQNGETREQRNNRRNRDDRQSQQQNATGSAPGDFTNQDQRPQRSNRGTGPPRRNFDGANRGKREFDRQSGSDRTGVKSIDKRDGAGAHNWGSVKQDIEQIANINKSQTEEAGLTDKEESGNEQTAEQQAAAAAAAAAIEEETKELTLDEWKAQRGQRAKPQYNIRKAGEGEDISQWKKMIALNSKKNKISVVSDGVESDDEFEYDPSMYPQRVGRLQRVLDIEFHFNDGRRGGGIGRGRGPRGPRGPGGPGGPGGAARQGGGDRPDRGQPREEGQGDRRERGGADRGQERGGARPRNENQRQRGDGERQQRGPHGQHAPKVDDERQFPTLS